MIFFILNCFRRFCRGSLFGGFAKNPDEGYRIHSHEQIPKTTQPEKSLELKKVNCLKSIPYLIFRIDLAAVKNSFAAFNIVSAPSFVKVL